MILELLIIVLDALSVSSGGVRGTREQRRAAKAAGRRLDMAGYPSSVTRLLQPARYREQLGVWNAREDAANQPNPL